MRAIVRLVFLALALTVVASALGAQQAPPAASAGDKITLDVVVTPKSGRPVGDLQQSDFTILDNKKPQTITSFSAVSGRDAPLDFLVVIDSVNAPLENIGYERLQIDKMLRADNGRLAYPFGIDVLTDTGIQKIADFSLDGNAVSDALDKSQIGIRAINRSAGFWGAEERLQICLQALGQVIASEAQRPGRKIVLWISPGWPLLSGPGVEIDSNQLDAFFWTIVRVSTDLRRNDITMFALNPYGSGTNMVAADAYQEFLKGVPNRDRVQIGDLGLQVIAVQSGGLAIGPANDIAALITQCIADSAPYYEISFVSPASDGPNQYHSLEVKIAKSGLTAHTHTGYYANPTPPPQH